ncbi:MAG: ATP-dependent Clp protease proteolytic subunit [Rubrobacter sp.]|jgi:membrane-bound serine protease (ClpP class)|nr:ATP-dependent Clp protease proteolytic subunit [Rubrobacter sp.]
MKSYLYYSLALGLALSLAVLLANVHPASPAAQEDGPEVYVAEVDGEIDGQVTDYLERVISEAEEDDAAAVAIRLDTPGGSLTATQDIVELISNAGEVPVVVYVAPHAAQAASAGTFLLMASDVAAMSPGSTTGAATPVGPGGQDIPGDIGNKATNDAVALITGLAEARDRNAEWAEEAVRDAASVNAEEALDMDIVEYVEPDLETVLEEADGDAAPTKELTLQTADATLVDQPQTFSEDWGFSPYLLIIPGILLGLGSIGLVIASVRSHQQEISTGREGMIGKIGEVRTTISQNAPGQIFVHGELWRAYPEDPDDAPLDPDTEAEVVEWRRNSVIVRPHEEKPKTSKGS